MHEHKRIMHNQDTNMKITDVIPALKTLHNLLPKLLV